MKLVRFAAITTVALTLLAACARRFKYCQPQDLVQFPFATGRNL